MVLFLCTVSYSKNNEQIVERIKLLENSDQRQIMFFIQNTIANINTNAIADGSMTSGKEGGGERERERCRYREISICNIPHGTHTHTHIRHRWYSSSPRGAGFSQLPESTLHTHWHPCFSLSYWSSIEIVLHDSVGYPQGYLQLWCHRLSNWHEVFHVSSC